MKTFFAEFVKENSKRMVAVLLLFGMLLTLIPTVPLTAVYAEADGTTSVEETTEGETGTDTTGGNTETGGADLPTGTESTTPDDTTGGDAETGDSTTPDSTTPDDTTGGSNDGGSTSGTDADVPSEPEEEYGLSGSFKDDNGGELGVAYKIEGSTLTIYPSPDAGSENKGILQGPYYCNREEFAKVKILKVSGTVRPSSLKELNFFFELIPDCEEFYLKGMELSLIDKSSNPGFNFKAIPQAQIIDISGWDLRLKSTNWDISSYLFMGLKDLKKIVMRDVTFHENNNSLALACDQPKLKVIDLTGADLSHITYYSSVAVNCPNVEELYLGNTGLKYGDRGEWSDIEWEQFTAERKNLKKLDISGMSFKGLTSLKAFFSDMKNLTYLNMNNCDVSTVENFSCMFEGCSALATLKLDYWDMSSAKYLGGMFRNCKKLKAPYFTYWDLKNVTSLTEMFRGCESIETLNLSPWCNFSNIEEMRGMFQDCKKLKTLKGIGYFVGKKTTNIQNMFRGCEKLESVDVSTWKMNSVENMAYIFEGCKKLNTIKGLSNLKTPKLKNMDGAFMNCTSLEKLNVLFWDTSSVTSAKNLFAGCTSLSTFLMSNKFVTPGNAQNGSNFVALKNDGGTYCVFTVSKDTDWYFGSPQISGFGDKGGAQFPVAYNESDAREGKFSTTTTYHLLGNTTDMIYKYAYGKDTVYVAVGFHKGTYEEGLDAKAAAKAAEEEAKKAAEEAAFQAFLEAQPKEFISDDFPVNYAATSDSDIVSGSDAIVDILDGVTIIDKNDIWFRVQRGDDINIYLEEKPKEYDVIYILDFLNSKYDKNNASHASAISMAQQTFDAMNFFYKAENGYYYACNEGLILQACYHEGLGREVFVVRKLTSSFPKITVTNIYHSDENAADYKPVDWHKASSFYSYDLNVTASGKDFFARLEPELYVPGAPEYTIGKAKYSLIETDDLLNNGKYDPSNPNVYHINYAADDLKKSPTQNKFLDIRRTYHVYEDKTDDVYLGETTGAKLIWGNSSGDCGENHVSRYKYQGYQSVRYLTNGGFVAFWYDGKETFDIFADRTAWEYYQNKYMSLHGINPDKMLIWPLNDRKVGAYILYDHVYDFTHDWDYGELEGAESALSGYTLVTIYTGGWSDPYDPFQRGRNPETPWEHIGRMRFGPKLIYDWLPYAPSNAIQGSAGDSLLWPEHAYATFDDWGIPEDEYRMHGMDVKTWEDFPDGWWAYAFQVMQHPAGTYNPYTFAGGGKVAIYSKSELKRNDNGGYDINMSTGGTFWDPWGLENHFSFGSNSISNGLKDPKTLSQQIEEKYYSKTKKLLEKNEKYKQEEAEAAKKEAWAEETGISIDARVVEKDAIYGMLTDNATGESIPFVYYKTVYEDESSINNLRVWANVEQPDALAKDIYIYLDEQCIIDNPTPDHENLPDWVLGY